MLVCVLHCTSTAAQDDGMMQEKSIGWLSLEFGGEQSTPLPLITMCCCNSNRYHSIWSSSSQSASSSEGHRCQASHLPGDHGTDGRLYLPDLAHDSS